MKCQEPGCTVDSLEGETTCSDHDEDTLTRSGFLEGGAARGGSKSAARKSSGGAFGLRPGSVQATVMAYLRSNPRVAFTPTELAAHLPWSKGTVSKAVSLLARKTDSNGDPWIMPVGAGAWRAFIDWDKMVDIEQAQVCVHAIQASMKVPPPGALGLTGPARGWDWSDKNGQYHRREWWGQHRVTITVSSTGTCQVSLTASDLALTPDGFELFLQWLDGTMTGLGVPFRSELASMDNLELNRDGRRLVVADARRFKMQHWRNAWAQMYQKDRDRLRTEIRLTKGRDYAFRMSEAASIVSKLAARPERIVEASEVYEPAEPAPWELI